MSIDLHNDLFSALTYNPQDFAADDVAAIHANVEGDDEKPYFWLAEVRGRGFVVLRGWHDFTGWDCQSDLYVLGWGLAATDALRESGAPPAIKRELLRQVVEGRTEMSTERVWRELGAPR